MARWGRWTVCAAIVAIAGVRVAVAWALHGGATRIAGFGIELAGERAPIGLSWGNWWVETLAAAVLVAGLLRLVRLLRRYEQGRPFDAGAALHLRGFALAVVASVLMQRLLPLMLAAGGVDAFGPPHLTLYGSDLWTLLTGGLLLLIAQVMAEAQRIAEDNERIV